MARSVPTIASVPPGTYLTGALWASNVKAMGDFLMGSGGNGVPRFSGYQNTVQSLTPTGSVPDPGRASTPTARSPAA